MQSGINLEKITSKFSKFLILTIVCTTGFVLLALTYYFAYRGDFNNPLFWVSILLMILPIFFLIIDEGISENKKIIYLITLGIAIYLIRTLPSVNNFHFGDEIGAFEVAKLIFEKGDINVPVHFEVSKYYPGFQLLIIFLKNLTEIDIFPASKIIIGILFPLFNIFLYLFIKRISSEQIAGLTAFLYSVSPMHVFFHVLFVNETLGIFFVIILLYIVSEMSSFHKSRNFRILAIIILPSLVLTHHFSSFMFFLFMLILVLSNLSRNALNRQHISLFFLTATLFIGWMIYVATVSIRYLYNTFISRLYKIFELSLLGGEKKDLFSTQLNIALLPIYEYIVTTYLYAPTILALSFIGIYIIYKYEKINGIIQSLIIFGPIIFIISLFLISTSGGELSIRFWGFIYIGISFAVAFAINRIMNGDINDRFFKKLTFFAVVIIIIGGISMGDKPIHREPSLLSPKVIGVSASITTDVYYSAQWFESKFGRHNMMSGYLGTAIVFQNYGMQDADRWNAFRVFLPKSIDNTVLEVIRNIHIKYILVDNRATKSLGEHGYYFENREIYKKYYPVYGFNETLPEENLGKFDKSNLLYSIYNNGNILIYKLKWTDKYEKLQDINN